MIYTNYAGRNIIQQQDIANSAARLGMPIFSQTNFKEDNSEQ